MLFHQLPDGTIVETVTSEGWPHAGIIVNMPDGRVLILNNSKRNGYAAAETPQGYSGGDRMRVFWIPPSQEEGSAALQAAIDDLGRQYALLDNCQHYVTRAAFGEASSPGLEFAGKYLAALALSTLVYKALSDR